MDLIVDFLLTHYLILKALHIISMVAWMAGMLYLPRLYIYHLEVGQTSRLAETFKIMERRLLRIIINPAMIFTFIFGGLMIWANPDLMTQGWMHAKLTAVLLMTGVHGMLAKYRRQFEQGVCSKTTRYFRILNEVPTVLLIAIVFLVVLKPF